MENYSRESIGDTPNHEHTVHNNDSSVCLTAEVYIDDSTSSASNLHTDRSNFIGWLNRQPRKEDKEVIHIGDHVRHNNETYEIIDIQCLNTEEYNETIYANTGLCQDTDILQTVVLIRSIEGL